MAFILRVAPQVLTKRVRINPGSDAPLVAIKISILWSCGANPSHRQRNLAGLLPGQWDPLSMSRIHSTPAVKSRLVHESFDNPSHPPTTLKRLTRGRNSGSKPSGSPTNLYHHLYRRNPGRFVSRKKSLQVLVLQRLKEWAILGSNQRPPRCQYFSRMMQK